MIARLLAVVALLAALAATVNGEGGKTAEEPISFASMFETLNNRFQNVTHTVEDILGIDIPTTHDEVKSALEDNLNGLKESAQKIQKKLAEYNVTESSFSGLLQQAQTQVDQTVQELGQRNPDVGKLLEQVKTGYSNLVDVSKQVQKVVEEQTGTTTEDLKSLAQQARNELSKAATQLETKVQGVVAEVQKKSKTS